MIVGNVAQFGVLVSVESDTHSIANARGTKQTATAAGRIAAERVVVKHECYAIGTGILMAEIDIEVDVKVGAQVDALIRHHRALLVCRVLGQDENICAGVMGRIAIESYPTAHLLR